MKEIGTRQGEITAEVLQMFKPVEGFNCLYYGKVRNGKTYAATADILELLERGERVVANWKIDFDGYDQRSSFRVVLFKFLTGRRDFYRFNADNFEYIPPADLLDKNKIALKYLNSLVYVHVFIDEGQWLFNSQERMNDPIKMELVLHGGHYCRSLNILTQRPSNVFKTMRSQINIWYKCEKRLTWPFVVFQRTEYQDMKDDLPDEEFPVGRPKTYIADQRIFDAYNTHAMRKDDADYRLSSFERYETKWYQRLYLLASFIVPTSFSEVWTWLSGAPAKKATQSPLPVPTPRSIRNVKKPRKIEVISLQPDLIPIHNWDNTLHNQQRDICKISMSYAKVCGYSDIVEVYRYDGDIGNGNKRNYAKPLVQSYFSEVGKDVSRQEKLSKARSKESASRAVVAFRRLVSANLSKSDIPVLASFTYRDNMQEIAIGRADFNAFARRASEAFGSQFRYICVSEFQRRGALHFHALIWGLLPSVVADERSTRMVATLWGQGFIDLVPTDGSKKLSTYLSKYMAKNFSDPRLFGRKAYIASRNIQRPWEEKGALLSPYFFGVNERGVNLSTAELLQEREYDTQWLGRANYKRFMLNAYAKSESREGDSDAV